MNTTNPPPAPGDLDPTYGVAGIATLTFANGVRMQTAQGLAMAPDGKVYVAGTTTKGEYALAQLNPNGSPDLTFADFGIARGKFEKNASNGLRIQIAADGKLILTANAYISDLQYSEALIARFSVNGMLDTTFGYGGWNLLVIHDPSPSPHMQLSSQADGKILSPGKDPKRAMIFRHNRDGMPDYSFAGRGYIMMDLLPRWSNFQAVRDQSGKVVAAGFVSQAADGTDRSPLLIRFTADGQLDESFSPLLTGDTSLEIDRAQFTNLLLTGTGKIIGVGATEKSGAPQRGLLLGRDQDGSPDLAFNGGKPVYTSIAKKECRWFEGALIPGSQKFAVAGDATADRGSALVGRFTANGSPDLSFGNGTGLAQFQVNGNNTLAFGVSAQSDQKLLVCGQTTNGSVSQGFVARLAG